MRLSRQRVLRVQVAALVLASWWGAACDVSVGNGGLSLGLVTGRATDTWTRTYQLTAGGRVEIINVNGRIEVEASDGPSVEVRAERTAKAGSDESARELLKKVEMREDVAPDSIRIETKAPKGLMGTSSTEVRYTIRVPRTARVNLETVNGAAIVNGVRGGVQVATTNGEITGRLLAGRIDATTTNGRVHLELDSVAQDTIKAETVNGRIEIEIPSTAKADIAARCVNGSINVSGLDLKDIGERTRRSMEARLNGGGARIEVETTNGSIRLAGKS